MATMPSKFIKQLELDDNTYEIIAGYISDGASGAKDWNDITSLISGSFQLIVSTAAADTPAGVTWKNAEGATITGTLAASAAEYPAIYFVPEDLTKSTQYREYIAVGSVAASRKWELIGRTDIDLSQYSKKTHTHTVTPSSMTIAATAEGAEVQIDSTTAAITGFGAHTTADAITGFGAHTTDNALGENATFTTTVTPTKTNIKATATGTTVSTSGANKALGEDTTFAVSGGALTGATAASKVADTWVTNVPTAIDTTKFNGGSITDGSVSGGVYSGATQASFTQGSKASFTQGSKAAWSAEVSSAGVLSFNFTANGDDTFTANGDDTFTANEVGSVSTISYTAPVLTPAAFQTGFYTAGSAAEFTEGTFTPNVVGSVSAIGVTANKTDVVDVISGVSVSAQPTIALATGAAAGTGVIEVATGITSATTEATDKDAVAAITALGTATTAKAITALGTATTEDVAKTISVKTQPTIKINDKASETVAAATQVSTSAAVEA